MRPAGAIRGDKNIAQPRTSAPPGRRRTAGGRLSRRPGQRSGHCFSGFPKLAGPGGPSVPPPNTMGSRTAARKKRAWSKNGPRRCAPCALVRGCRLSRGRAPAAGGPGKSSRGKGGSVLPAVSASGLLRALRRARLIADFKKVDDVALRRARRGAPVTGGAGPRSHAKRAPENRGPCRYWSVRPSGLRCSR